MNIQLVTFKVFLKNFQLSEEQVNADFREVSI